MKNLFLGLLSAVLVYSCSVEDLALFGTDEAGIKLKRSSAAIGDSLTITVTLMSVSDTVTLLSVSGNHHPANSFLLIGGNSGIAFKSDTDGDNWTLSYGGTYYYGGIGDINALKWSRSAGYNNWRICIAAGTNGIWHYNATSDYWWPIFQDDNTVFTATASFVDPHGYAGMWHIAGFRDSMPCLYNYTYFQGGSYIYFYELDMSMFEHKITNIASLPQGNPLLAVSDGGEVGVTYNNSSPSTDLYEIIQTFNIPLYASCVFESFVGTKMIVGGDSGFMSYAFDSDSDTWISLSSGISSRINSIVVSDWYEEDLSVVVAGGNGGQFSYSVDGGETFTPYDIGFGVSNINSIAYYDYDQCFYAVGDEGKIARIKITRE